MTAKSIQHELTAAITQTYGNVPTIIYATERKLYSIWKETTETKMVTKTHNHTQQ